MERNYKAGVRLQGMRRRAKLSLRGVFTVSKEIARAKRNRNFIVPPSRLSEIEREGSIPTIYRLYALSRAYKSSMRRLLSFYGL